MSLEIQAPARPSFGTRVRRAFREEGTGPALRRGFRRLAAPVVESGALHFFARELDGPLPESPPSAGLTVREASERDVDALLRGSDPFRSASALCERFRRADRCFAVFDADGEVLHSRWLTSGSPYLPEVRRSLLLPPHTAYFYDGFTRRDARGRGLDGVARSAIFAALRAEGYRRALSYVRGDNPAGLRAARRWQSEGGRIRYLRMGRRVLLFGGASVPEGSELVSSAASFDEAERSERARRWRRWFESWLEEPAEKRSTGFDSLPAGYFAAMSDFVAGTLELSAVDDSVLDVGCDSAMVSRGVAGRCRRLTGVDLVPGLLWNAPPPRADGERRPDDMLATDARRLPFRSAAFDKVYCLSMIHTLPSHEDAYRVVAELVRVCAPGGRILVGGVPDRARRGRARREAWRRGGWGERLRIVGSLLLPAPVKPLVRRLLTGREAPALVSLDFDFGAFGRRLARLAVEWRIVPFGDDFWSRDFRQTRSNLLISVPRRDQEGRGQSAAALPGAPAVGAPSQPRVSR